MLNELMMNEDYENNKDHKINEEDKQKTNVNCKQENHKNDKNDENVQYNAEERHYIFAILVLMIVAANKTSNKIKSIKKGNKKIDWKYLVRDMKILVESINAYACDIIEYSHNMGKDSFNKLVNIQWALNEMDIEIEQCDHKNDNNDIWECENKSIEDNEYDNDYNDDLNEVQEVSDDATIESLFERVKRTFLEL
ncbi:hypothetical protein C2G38_2215595 [Gigaspora rosea]|uniref:Uncharacterized protein n=1 Tax=Gigaspora rosea TaxID=44941 RepID=A0A397U9M6_9GLOM|nr:hypothetical protein C2G38_2215595 [Gigaspora rosea]